MCSGCDAHLTLSAVKPRHGEIILNLNNMERHTSFTMNDVTFIHKVVSTCAVLPQQIIQQLEQRLIQVD